jgi:GTP-binding protein HflX
VLAEIGAGGIPEVLVLNKLDLLSELDRDRAARRHQDGVPVSALRREGLEPLLERLEAALPRPPIEVELLIPYERGDVMARLYREAEVLAAEPDTSGTSVRARVREDQLAWAGDFTVRPVSRRSRLA